MENYDVLAFLLFHSSDGKTDKDGWHFKRRENSLKKKQALVVSLSPKGGGLW